MKYLKFALFSFIAAIIIYIAERITHIEILLVLTSLASIACVGALLIWICTKIFNKFRYSVNVIVIIAFAAIAVIAYALQPEAVQTVYLSDLQSISFMSLIALAATMGVLVSTLVLVWKLIFTNKDKNSDDQVQSPNESEIAN